MVGGDIPPVGEPPSRPTGRDVLEVRDLWVRGSRGHHAVRGVSFAVRAGEIFGVAGVSGNGQEELADCVCGLARQERGEILLDGRVFPGGSGGCLPRRSGVHSRRQAQGRPGARHDSEENLVLKTCRLFPEGLSPEGAIRENAERRIADYGIRPPLPGSRTASLSGGNQQKVVAAREIEAGRNASWPGSRPGGLTWVPQPTFTDARRCPERRQGRFLVSTELSEIMSLSDTVAVMTGGEILGIFPGRAPTFG